MNLVLADISMDTLIESGKKLNIPDSRVKYVKCDVSKENQVKDLADISFEYLIV
jgi:hypothetical protein